jgi:hypothetical protein
MLTASILGIEKMGPFVKVWGKVLPSATSGQGYTTAQGGDWLNLLQQAGPNSAPAAVLDANFSGPADVIPSSGAPIIFDAWSQGGQFTYQIVPNLANTTNASNLQVLFGADATFGTELGTGNYPAALSGDDIAFLAVFKALQ